MKTNSEESFDWADAVADSAIMSGITFFSTLAATSVIGQSSLVAAGIAAALQFFTILAIKRKLVRE